MQVNIAFFLRNEANIFYSAYENAVKCKKTVLNPSDVPISTKLFVKSYKKGLHGPDTLHELEMLVANLICVHAKLTRDRQPSIQRSTGTSRSTGWAPLIKLI